MDDNPRLLDALAEMQRLQREFPDHIVFATARGDVLETWPSKVKTHANRLAEEGRFVVLLDGQRLLPAASFKRCGECRAFKRLDEFAADPRHRYDGRSSRCHECSAEMARKYADAYRRMNRVQLPSLVGDKYCPRCRETKDKLSFARCAASASGLQTYCRKCMRLKRLTRA